MITLKIEAQLRYQDTKSDKVYIGVISNSDLAMAFYGKHQGTLQGANYAVGRLRAKLTEKRRKGYEPAGDLLTSGQRRYIRNAFAISLNISPDEVHLEGYQERTASETPKPKAPDPKIEQKRAGVYDDW